MSGWIETLLQWVLGALALAALVTLYRLVRGPSLPDRVVALDLLALELVGGIAADSILAQESRLLDVALILAIISSLGTIAVARYIFSGERGRL